MEIKIEKVKIASEEEVKKWDIEYLQSRFLEIQEIAKYGNILIQKQQQEIQYIKEKLKIYEKYVNSKGMKEDFESFRIVELARSYD